MEQGLWHKIRLEVEELTPYYTTVKDMPSISITLEQFSTMVKYYDILRDKFFAPESKINSMILKKVVVILFYEIYQLYFYLKEHAPNPCRDEKILQNFIKLVAINFKQKRSVEFYASHFSLTPKYLSSIIKRASEITASQWIDNYVIAEASVLLRTTTLSVKEIADELNFSDQSAFGKYFKRRKGVSPQQYKAF